MASGYEAERHSKHVHQRSLGTPPRAGLLLSERLIDKRLLAEADPPSSAWSISEIVKKTDGNILDTGKRLGKTWARRGNSPDGFSNCSPMERSPNLKRPDRKRRSRKQGWSDEPNECPRGSSADPAANRRPSFYARYELLSNFLWPEN